MRFVPNTNPPIENEGLERYLNRTKDQHDGNDYAEFARRVGYGEPKTIIAVAFQVSTKTIYRWLEIYEKENNNASRS